MIPRIIGHYPDGRPIYQMAGGDNVTVDNGDLSDFTASTDTAASGEVQRVKLTYSADASDTHIDADADGLKVNVSKAGTITPGTAATSLGKATDEQFLGGHTGVAVWAVRDDVASAYSGSDGDYEPFHTDADGNLRTLVSFASTINSGTNLIGRTQISDGTVATGDAVTASVIDTGGTNDALAVGLVDSAGDQLAFAKPAEVAATGISVDTSAYAANDSLDSTVWQFASATASAAGSGWITKLVIYDVDGQEADMEIWFANASVTPSTENTAFSLSEADMGKVQAVISTTTGAWYSSNANGSVCVVPVSPPIPFKLAAAQVLYAAAKTLGTPTYTASDHISVTAHILQD